MTVRQADLVLFDLGGVIIELNGVGAMQELAGIEGEEEIWRRWLTSPWVRRFESGRCSADEFSNGVVSEWGLPVSAEQFMDAFLQWPTGPFPGAPELLDEVRATVPIGCLSNTNTAHWEYQVATWPILELFEYRFLSFDLGLVKPDPDLFEEVAARLPVPRDRVLFLDDNAMNADAARTAGFLAGHVRGVDEAREVLVRMGVVED
ncbi:MAG: HAD family phosphatase [Acidimicrobiales bacterium]|jgi:putative hydrolase of the HAD superfamily